MKNDENEAPAGVLEVDKGSTTLTDAKNEDNPGLVQGPVSSSNVCKCVNGCGDVCGCLSVPSSDKVECLVIGGICKTCDNNVVNDFSVVNCNNCKRTFHAFGCRVGSTTYANKSLMTVFKRDSTRNNFLFSCDTCLTEAEMLKADEQKASYQLLQNRIARLESLLMSELCEIKSMMAPVVPEPSVSSASSAPSVISGPSVPTNVPSVGHPATSLHGWKDPARIAACKSTSTFLIKSTKAGEPVVDISKLNDIAIENSLTISKSSVNSKGHTIVVVDGKSSSEAFVPAVSKAVSEASVVKLQSRLPTVVFVGMHSTRDPEDIQNILSVANPTLRSLIDANSFKILTVKPLKNNNGLFQFIARVSNEIRSHLKSLDDKVFFGANRLHIYDHFFVRRCNKCQLFGHFEKTCKSTEQICGVCASSGHSSISCSVKSRSDSHKCSNCVKNQHPHNHLSSSPSCKSFIDEQKKLKHSISYYNSGSKNLI